MSALFCPPGHLLLQPEAPPVSKSGLRVGDSQDRQLRRAKVVAAPLDWSNPERQSAALIRPQDAENLWRLPDGSEVACVEISKVVAFEP